jgi:nicotinate-nucleotide pyrophosphorylase (carboxylating)
MFYNQTTSNLIDLALSEDIGLGDITSASIFDAEHKSRGVVLAKENMVLCGLDLIKLVFSKIDPSLKVKLTSKDGTKIKKGTRVASITGSTLSLLAGERTALNFIQRLSGIATQSSKYAELVKDSGIKIIDTRKTMPGWRYLEKYAVKCGGCYNHRLTLSEQVLIKDNHIAAAGSLEKAVKLARLNASHLSKIEVEAKTLSEVKQAIKAKADIVLLDNMSPDLVKTCIALIDGKMLVEVSGGVTYTTLNSYLIKGVDFISVGALTHSVRSVDLSLDIIDY